MEKIDFRAEGKQLAWDYLLVTLGALLTAFAFVAFFLPHDIAPGGVTGIATVLSSVTGLNVGLLSFLINLPLFAIGWRRVGLRFAVRSFHLDDTALTVHRRDAGFRSGGQHDAGGDFWRRDDGRGAGPCGARGCDDGRHGHGRYDRSRALEHVYRADGALCHRRASSSSLRR